MGHLRSSGKDIVIPAGQFLLKNLAWKRGKRLWTPWTGQRGTGVEQAAARVLLAVLAGMRLLTGARGHVVDGGEISSPRLAAHRLHIRQGPFHMVRVGLDAVDPPSNFDVVLGDALVDDVDEP